MQQSLSISPTATDRTLLVLGFSRLFLRDAVPREGDLVFNKQGRTGMLDRNIMEAVEA